MTTSSQLANHQFKSIVFQYLRCWKSHPAGPSKFLESNGSTVGRKSLREAPSRWGAKSSSASLFELVIVSDSSRKRVFRAEKSDKGVVIFYRNSSQLFVV